jgi:hypothetical protein
MYQQPQQKQNAETDDVQRELDFLRTDNDQCKQKIQLLSKENEILKRNLSALFRTAQLEIQRKDEEIKRLRQQ